MPATARLVHRTVYSYDRPVRLGPQWVRLRPMPDARRPALAYRLVVEPEPVAVNWQIGPLGNFEARVVLAGEVRRLALEVTAELDLAPLNAFDFLLDPEAERWPFRYAAAAAEMLAPYLRAEYPGPLLGALRGETAVAADVVPFVLAVVAAVRDRVAYIVREEAGVWPPDRTLMERRGSCRDSAWLLVQLLRLHGVAARFVSGYLVQTPEDGRAMGAELHAWAEAYLPGAGWVGIDATSGYLTAEGHVGLAAGPSPREAAPVSGTVAAAGVRLETSIEVERLPR